MVIKDTIAANKQYDEIDAGEDAEGADAAVRLDAFIHHCVPVLARQYLKVSIINV